MFKNYNWTVDYEVNSVKETLPLNLKYDVGENPIKLYWAYNNELSKSIGLDYSKYLGKSVVAYIYRLREPLPSFMKPRMDARGIVLKYDGKIIGAYIDAAGYDCFACSLQRKSLETVTKRTWDNWVSQYINYSNVLEIKLSKMEPKEIIKIYFDAMNRHDEKTLNACMTCGSLCDYLAANMANNQLINPSFASAYPDGNQNVISAKLLKVEVESDLPNPVGVVEYRAIVDYKFKKEITSSSGEQDRFILLKKESAQGGWKIQSLGTGP